MPPLASGARLFSHAFSAETRNLTMRLGAGNNVKGLDYAENRGCWRSQLTGIIGVYRRALHVI